MLIIILISSRARSRTRLKREFGEAFFMFIFDQISHRSTGDFFDLGEKLTRIKIIFEKNIKFPIKKTNIIFQILI